MRRALGVLYAAQILLCATGLATAARAEPQAPPSASEPAPAPAPAAKTLGQRLTYYLPSRLADALDPVRARLRFGPGFGFGVRLTRPASFYAGGHAAFFIGLRGPRSAPIPPLPFGTEADGSRTVTAGSRRRAPVTVPPGYTVSELGLGFHLAIFGLDLGVDPLEVADLAGGLLTLDFRGDDF
jgi:hypothetical protein